MVVGGGGRLKGSSESSESDERESSVGDRVGMRPQNTLAAREFLREDSPSPSLSSSTTTSPPPDAPSSCLPLSSSPYNTASPEARPVRL